MGRFETVSLTQSRARTPRANAPRFIPHRFIQPWNEWGTKGGASPRITEIGRGAAVPMGRRLKKRGILVMDAANGDGK